ncbi:hypothetical protein [Holospora elegans]|nr:hypothetical protein [Holospora elegans]
MDLENLEENVKENQDMALKKSAQEFGRVFLHSVTG